MMKNSVINMLQVPPRAGTVVKSAEPKPIDGGRVEPQVPQESGKDLPSNRVPALPEQDFSGVVEVLNDYLQSVKRDLQFAVDDQSGRTIITVMERETREVIRQIPPDAVLALVEYLRAEGDLGSFGVAEEA